jgi:hypothetical protein
MHVGAHAVLTGSEQFCHNTAEALNAISFLGRILLQYAVGYFCLRLTLQTHGCFFVGYARLLLPAAI